MKKIVTHLTGIVLLIAVLTAGGCQADLYPLENQKEVKIYLKAIKRGGKKHLKMFDSNKPGHVVIDTLETLVMPGDTVFWEPKKYFSKIDKLVRIGPETPGTILIMDAVQVPDTKNFMLIIPEGAPTPSDREKYDIMFIDKRGDTITIDPYLRIPPQSGGGPVLDD